MVIKLGNTGDAVLRLQHELVRLGYDIKADGIFGSKTLRTVKNFQQTAGLTADGIADSVTLALLHQRAEALGIQPPQSKHFNMGLFISPADMTAAKFGVPEKYWANIQTVMERLERLQKMAGYPLVIRSGYRSPAYNKRVGGAANSQHLFGRAADIYVKDYAISCYTLARMIDEDPALKGLFGGIGLGSKVNVHVDIRPRKNPATPTVWWYTHQTWKAWERA